MTSMVGIDASERELAEQLQAALAPSFVLVRRLGAGGMGIVFLARDPALKRLVAVKLMSPERAADPEARARFEREAESVAAISHPNVVAVYSVGELKNGLPYLVMQYVDGPTMAERLTDEGPLDLESAKAIIGQVASALGAAHRKGIIHRDIKAANVLWDEHASRALVTDFGIAAILARDVDGESIDLTQTGMVMGTPRYMSPEQLLSEPVTEKTDIYSLGLLGYELLTGEGPYSVTSPNAIVAAHLRDAPRPLSSLRPDADPELESLLASCLEKDAHGRPSAEDVARRLERGASVLLEWPPPGLESLHGAIGRPLSMLLGGSLAIAVPLYIGTMSTRGSGLRLAWPQVLILPSVAAIGGLAIVICAVESAQLARLAIRAARAGYGWTTIAEVLVDEKHDTGALISGEREYAALTPAQRTRFRRGRLVSTALRIGAGLWAIVGFFVTMPLSVRLFKSPGMVAFCTLGIPLLTLIAARVVSAEEWRALRVIRSRIRTHRGPIERLSHLAATWRDSFDRLLSGAGLGHGATDHVRRKVAGLIGITALVGVAAAFSYGLLMFSVLGQSDVAGSLVFYTSVQEKAARVEPARVLRPPIDPSITPLRAGQAMQSILLAGGAPSGPLEKPAAYPIERPILAPGASQKGPFKKRWADGGAIAQAKLGLNAEQRKFLETIASEPGGPELSIMAHAASIDYVAAALVQPFPDGTSFSSVPVGKFSRLKFAAYGNVARASLDLADGKPDVAERRLRENIGAGFAMLDSPTMIENLFGVVTATIGRIQLVALYEATGRGAEARAISMETVPARDEVLLDANPAKMTPADRDAYFQAMIRQPSKLRGLRWESMLYLAYQPCSDMRQVLLGPDSLHLARLAEARRLLVHNAGENQLMILAEQTLARPPQETGSQSLGQRAVLDFARTVDMLTGSHRMESCALRPR
jgi:hypothetical protein